MFEAKEILSQNNDWITLVFFTIFVILVAIKFFFNERLAHTSMLLFSKKYLAIYYSKEKKKVFNNFQVLFFLVQLLTFSLIFFEILRYKVPSFSQLDGNIFVLIFICVFLYFVVRFLIGFFLASIFNFNEFHKKLLYEKSNYFNSLVISILPFLLVLFYTESYQLVFFKITLIVFLFLLTLRYVLVLRNNKKVIFGNLFYFILYLCALEIGPLVIILKLTI
ncbi:DUF4271 domain-containing protein [Lutibacter holmesii]|uniref:DUF4271 domain-containing protein n=1 Tax=Lutibacter holmesii TaxID=1137985 RepID=A0ABW3WKY1_9FLAO